jgi:hypothetical protein
MDASNKKNNYYTVRTVSKYNWKFVESETKTQIKHDRLLACYFNK